MPYRAGKGHGCSGSKPWAAYNADTGAKYGCHPNRAAAVAQVRALYSQTGHKNAAPWRWLSIYSNTFLDRGRPGKLITTEAHARFIYLVNKGLLDYPEVWHMHIPGTAWGKADILFLSDNFAVAAGYVYPDHYATAEQLAKMRFLAVSISTPYASMLTDPANPDAVTTHVIREISVFPHWFVANPLTDLIVYRYGEL